jgi:type VI protein secretion system component Hcp
MAIDAFLYLDAREGPSLKRPGAIDILSFSFGATMTSSYGAGRSGAEAATGNAAASDVSVMCVSDKLTPELFRDLCTGHNFPVVKIEYEKPVGDEQQAFFRVAMEDAHLSSLQLTGSSENPMLSLSFAAEKIKVSYNPQSDESSFAGFVDGGFDFGKMVKW